MSRTLLETYERQRIADAMEAQRIEARLKEFSQKPTREERIAMMVQDGWSLRTARDDIHTKGWGGPSAYAESCKAEKFANLPAIGGCPSKARPARS